MSRSTRTFPSLLALLMAVGGFAATAQAATTGSGAGTHPAVVAGTYSGHINQLAPQAYTGHIHFVVAHGKLTHLKFTAGTMCGVVWAIDTDNAVPAFSVKIKSTGAFSYKGTVGGRTIHLKGTVKGSKAHGTFFQSFPTGSLTCTMGQAASFTASRRALTS